MVKDSFVDTWRLVASEFKPSDEVIAYPYGKDAAGMLVCDEHAHMCVQITRRDQPSSAGE